jgi:hypothetical protein
MYIKRNKEFTPAKKKLKYNNTLKYAINDKHFRNKSFVDLLEISPSNFIKFYQKKK